MCHPKITFFFGIEALPHFHFTTEIQEFGTAQQGTEKGEKERRGKPQHTPA